MITIHTHSDDTVDISGTTPDCDGYDTCAADGRAVAVLLGRDGPKGTRIELHYVTNPSNSGCWRATAEAIDADGGMLPVTIRSGQRAYTLQVEVDAPRGTPVEVQLLAHLLGDYIFQSEWMAQGKRKSMAIAAIHGLAYSLPFIILCTPTLAAWVVIVVTHAAIDHWALARFVVFAKNHIAPRHAWPSWERCSTTGYDQGAPVWLTTWLLILTDNLLHLCINAAALGWL